MILEIGELVLTAMVVWGIVAIFGDLYDSFLDWIDRLKQRNHRK